ncbi:hypothetical protein Rs2_28377 [Raphanus sativus]|nr:hypothetical protein Rs2_28377 [Raphanus sativus]
MMSGDGVGGQNSVTDQVVSKKNQEGEKFFDVTQRVAHHDQKVRPCLLSVNQALYHIHCLLILNLKPPINVDDNLTPSSETTGHNKAPLVTNLSHGSSPDTAATNPSLHVVKSSSILDEVDAKLILSSQFSGPSEAPPVTKLSHDSLLACSTAKNTSLPVLIPNETTLVDEALIGTLVNDQDL